MAHLIIPLTWLLDHPKFLHVADAMVDWIFSFIHGINIEGS